MDERLIIGDWQKVDGVWKPNQTIKQSNNQTIDFSGAFYDDSLMPMSEWREKHRKYAQREAEQAIAGTSQDPRKAAYYKLPPYLRAFAYFCIRYFLKGGILDGYAGWMWNFWQGLWYRCLVDREIAKLANKV